MNALSERLRNGAEQLWQVIPAMLIAILILVAGYFVARTIEKWVDATLKRLNFNKVAEAGGLREAVDRTGSRMDPEHAVGKLLFWLMMLIVILLASAALGLESINEMFGIMISFIPTLISAIVIVILGMIVVRRRRAAGGPAENALKTLVGLELRPRRTRDAANLWAAIRATRSEADRDAAWSHPDLIPTSADLDDPLGYAEHGHGAAAPDDLDAELAKLLDEERGDQQG